MAVRQVGWYALKTDPSKATNREPIARSSRTPRGDEDSPEKAWRQGFANQIGDLVSS